MKFVRGVNFLENIFPIKLFYEIQINLKFITQKFQINHLTETYFLNFSFNNL